MQNLFNNYSSSGLNNKEQKETGNYFTNKTLFDLAASKQMSKDNEVNSTKYGAVSKEWVNSVYSFNPNYIKPLAMVDIMVNRLIKSYFNFVKLIWKKKYKLNAIELRKKFRLIKRRKKAEIKKNKLSLNKVFVSKGEIKHTNNKIVTTFYIFNRSKKFLLYKLKNLYEAFSFSKLNKNYKKNSNKTRFTRNKLNISSLINKNRSKNISSNISQVKVLRIGNTKYKNNNGVFNAKENFFKSKRKFDFTNILFNPNNLSTKSRASKEKNKNLYNRIYLANLTKKRLSRFISKINNTDVKNKYITLAHSEKNLYDGITKYKLYNTNNIEKYGNDTYNVNLLNLSNNVLNHETQNNTHLSTFYKLFNRNYVINFSCFTKYFKLQTVSMGIDTKSSIIKKIDFLLLKKTLKTPNKRNIVHILKSFYKSFFLYNTKYVTNHVNAIFENKKRNNSSVDNNEDKTLDVINNKSYLLNTLYCDVIKNKSSLSLPHIKLKVMMFKIVKLINKIRRYKKFIIKSLELELSTINHKNINKRFVSYEKTCIKNFLRKTYRKEWLYIRYAKMLLFNRNKYRNNFLLGLKNVISKLYNKKIEFNFVNLKYIYLNSDILSRSIASRLRNRRNRLLTVLNKAVLLANIPSVNNKWEFDSSNNNTVNNRTIKDKNLSFIKTIASFDGPVHINSDSLNLLLRKINLSNVPCSIESKKLNATQKNALSSVNNKAVFGVRLEAAGRLTRRLTASRSVSKLKYRGSIKNINSSRYGLSSLILKGNLRSNLQYTKISSKTRNGSFGLKGWVSAY